MASRSLTVFLGCCACICLGLGIWQLQRLSWKTNLLQQIAAHRSFFLAPDQLTDSPQNSFYGLHIQGHFIHNREVLLQGRMYQHLRGFYVLTPFSFVDGREILVNRGWVAPHKIKTFPRPTGQLALTGVLFPASSKNFWTPPNQPLKGEWYWIDLQTLIPQGFQKIYVIAQQEGEKKAAPNSSLPPTLPNNHFGYAITWFALAVIAFLFAVHIRYRAFK